MKVAFCIHSLQAGGMERVCWQLICFLADSKKHEIHLVLFGKQPELFFEVPKTVVIHRSSEPFKDSQRLLSTMRRMSWLRNTIKKLQPDRIMSFGEYWNSLVLLSLLGLNTKVFVSDRSQPNKSLGKLHDRLRAWLYPIAETVIAQTSKALSIYQNEYTAKNWATMGNPIRSIGCSSVKRKKEILMVGRFIRSKHQDQLIKIFSKIQAPDWTLVLVGDDHLKQQNKDKWEQLARELGVEHRVKFEGKRSNVEDYYCGASIFAFTSSSEGFPNVIGEAQSAGLPVVAYDCIAGPSELIQDGINGYLIPLFDETLFQEKLQRLIDSEELRLTFGEQGQKSIKNFSVEKVGAKFMQILEI